MMIATGWVGGQPGGEEETWILGEKKRQGRGKGGAGFVYALVEVLKGQRRECTNRKTTCPLCVCWLVLRDTDE